MTAPKVLVIDDEPTIVELIALILRQEQIEVDVALQGEEGLAKCRLWRPDALVLDLMLPDIDGYEICQRIKADPNTASIRVLMLTALQSHPDRVRGFASGADLFLTKPFMPDVLVAELHSLLDASVAAEPGLRRCVQFAVTDDAQHKKQMLALLETLLRSTPLSPAEIDAVGRALLALGKMVVRRRQQTPPPKDFSLSCRIFADRLELRLELESESAAAARDLFGQVLGVANLDLPIPNSAALGQSRFHADDQYCHLVFTRNFSATAK